MRTRTITDCRESMREQYRKAQTNEEFRNLYRTWVHGEFATIRSIVWVVLQILEEN